MHTPHEPPFWEQCLQYLQFLHALHDELPVQVAQTSVSISPTEVERTTLVGSIVKQYRTLEASNILSVFIFKNIEAKYWFTENS